ncbi:hypothetical protein P4H61_07610 [Paenibacillus peoriae]|uniref:hypothetical protein n=1 Tax=Paenibacillus peoriae TaxID=59893 RepID=UPI00026C571E|nr:hypothetical protein [Paenibacillus peoriae]MEC0181365.1 hypothetical protein [Paenibacillus peoriae]
MRWLGWLLKKGMTVVLVSVLTLAVTGVVVNAYVQSLLRQFNIQLDRQPIWGLGWLNGNSGVDKSTDIGKSTDTGKSSDTGKNKETGGSSGNATPPDGALPVMGQGLDEGKGGTGATTPETGQSTSIEGHDLVITPDHLTEKKNNLPAAQKQEIFTILMNKLPPEEMQKISAAMEGGLTEQELQDIQQVLAKYLTKEEYNKLMNMLK